MSLGAWERDMNLRLGLSPAHVRKSVATVREFLGSSGLETLIEVTPGMALSWLGSAIDQENPGSRKTTLNKASHLRRFGDFLVVIGECDANPFAALRMPRVTRGFGSAPFTLEDVRALVKAARIAESTSRRAGKYGPLRSTFYGFLAQTGLRYSEARFQRWSEVDLEAGSMTLTADKSRRKDRVPLSDECVALLRIWRTFSREERVFPRVPSHHSLERDCRAAGISCAVGQWHRFRKAAITERARRGASYRDLHKFARHTDVSTTARFYDKATTEETRWISNLLPDVMGIAKESTVRGVDEANSRGDDVPATAQQDEQSRMKHTTEQPQTTAGLEVHACVCGKNDVLGHSAPRSSRAVPTDEWSRGESNPRAGAVSASPLRVCPMI